MQNDQDLKGLGGWLILVGLGIVITPINMIFTHFPTYMQIIGNGTLFDFFNPLSNVFNPLFGIVLVGELLINIAILVASFYLIFLFFTKHYLFPKFYIAITLFFIVFFLADAWIISLLVPSQPMFDDQTLREFARMIIVSLIWIPYMLISKRVRVTFVENTDE